MKLIILCTLFVRLSSGHEYEVGRPEKLNCNCGWTTLENYETIYPWVVAILEKENESFLCAGTILTKWHVVSSADCLQNKKPKDILVCTGSNKASKCAQEGTKMNVEKITINAISLSDLVMVHTTDGIGFDKYVGPACFPNQESSNKKLIDTDLLFLGWGGTVQIKTLHFKVKKQDICSPIYPGISKYDQICAVPISQQNVNGDGGGAFLMLDKDTKRYTVVGVLSGISFDITQTPKPSLMNNFTANRVWAKLQISSNWKAVLCEKDQL